MNPTPTEHVQTAFTFAQARTSANDIDAMRKQERLLEQEVEERTQAVKDSDEWTTLQQSKEALKSVREQIAAANVELVNGLVGSDK